MTVYKSLKMPTVTLLVYRFLLAILPPLCRKEDTLTTSSFFHLSTLNGPPMLVDKTYFGLVIYNHAYFYRFEETFRYWSVKRISVFFCFSLVNQRHTSGITMYNRTVTNIENTVRAVQSCNSWFTKVFSLKPRDQLDPDFI